MPTYEYECGKGHRFADIKPVAARDDCPLCDSCGGASRRVVSMNAPPVQRFDSRYIPDEELEWDHEQKTMIEQMDEQGVLAEYKPGKNPEMNPRIKKRMF